MEGIERRSESPPTRTRSSSRLSNISNQETDSDLKESLTKKRSSKRITRNNDKENSEDDLDTNGVTDIDERTISDKGDVKEVNGMENSDVEPENGIENVGESNGYIENIAAMEGINEGCHNTSDTDFEAKDVLLDENEKPVNGGSVTSGSIDVQSTDREESVCLSPKNDSLGANTEESYYTADADSLLNENNGGEPSSNGSQDEENVADSNGRVETRNGCESDMEDLKTSMDPQNAELGSGTSEHSSDENSLGNLSPCETKKGFLSKWPFKLTSDKKTQDTNSQADTDSGSVTQLYFSSIRGRMPLSRASPNVALAEGWKGSRGTKTPNNARNLNDSFGVKSEPPRSARPDTNDRTNLRKFPAKRCLNADESDKDDSFLSNLTFSKRRKIEDKETRTGFLRNFLRSPFRKSVTEDVGKVEVAKSWFRSPFWFWRRCSGSEEKDS